MRITKLRQQMTAGLAVIALSMVAAPAAKAACGTAASNVGTFAPALGSLQDPAALDQERSSDQVGSSEGRDREKDDSDVGVLGFWKVIYFAGGVLNDVGFEQLNAGGTELLNDSPPPASGNNFCMGAWKRVGTRTYAIVHPFFLFDASGKKPIGVVIVEQRMTVSRDGNTFAGTWSQDNYDFSGKLIPGNHFEGPVTGTRIAPGLPFPFPFPF